MGRTFNDLQQRDYSKFDKLKKADREKAAREAMRNPDVVRALVECNTPQEFTARLKANQALFNPAIRLGISMMKDGNMPGGMVGHNEQFYADTEREINKQVFVDTITPVTGQQATRLVETVGDRKAIEMINRNRESQKTLGRMAFMAQLGLTSAKMPVAGPAQTRRGAGVPIDYVQTPLSEMEGANISDLFACGGRTGFILPHSADAGARNQTISSIYGPNRGAAAGNQSRISATHSVTLPEVGGDPATEWAEHKPKFHTSGQFGMDVPVGGLGNPGVSRRPLLNDGTCGHVFSHIQPGDDMHHGMLLVGFESDSPGKTNQLGHTHNILATEAKSTCFGSQKSGIIGEKKGGRTVDLSGLTPDQLQEALQRYDDRVTELQNDPARAGELDQLLQNVSGRAMNRDQLVTFLETIGYTPQNARDLADNARQTPAPELDIDLDEVDVVHVEGGEVEQAHVAEVIDADAIVVVNVEGGEIEQAHVPEVINADVIDVAHAEGGERVPMRPEELVAQRTVGRTTSVANKTGPEVTMGKK